VGLLLERPNAGVMRVATSPGPGGGLLRRLVLPAILAPVLLGLLVTRLFAALGVEDLALLVATLAVAMTVVSLLLLTITAVQLNRAHEALESSRARTRDLVEQAPDGIFVADLNGRYTDVNSAGCHMLGYSREEIVGKTIVDLMPPEDVERLGQIKEQLLAGEPQIAEWTLRRKDGTYVPVEVSAKILRGGRWQGFVRDITERKRLEEELRVLEARSSGIVSISADAIISVDESQRITMFNDGAEKIFGYSKAEAVGAPLDILIPERLRAVHRQHVEEFADGQEIARRMGERSGGIWGLRKNGEEFPADAAISKLQVGGTTVLTVALRDVTEQERREREQKFLADVGSLLATTLDYEGTPRNVANLVASELADFCIVETVEEGGQVRRLTVAHRDPGKAAVADALQGVSVDRRRPHLGSSVLDTKQTLHMSDVPWGYLESITQSDEHRRALFELDPKSLIALPLVAHGRLLGSMVLVSTTASHHYSRADLPLAEEVARRAAWAVENARLYRLAQRATQARDDVLGIVAHDLRTPLGTILMQAKLLRPFGAEPERRSPKPAETIERAASRMSRLIQDLLDVTRIEGGGMSVEKAGVSACQVVSDSVEAQRPLASSVSLELQLDVAQDVPAVWGDYGRLLQVFENLIGNAIKFTAPGGRITVGAAPRDGDVLFWVADTGAGIGADALPRLFDRFWQARKAGRRGAGLGLPIVKGLVEAHGGRIWVESTPGRGTTFFFTIPVAPRAEAWRSAEPSPHGL
jgi:PAS domain S-box-containing protein